MLLLFRSTPNDPFNELIENIDRKGVLIFSPAWIVSTEMTFIVQTFSMARVFSDFFGKYLIISNKIPSEFS